MQFLVLMFIALTSFGALAQDTAPVTTPVETAPAAPMVGYDKGFFIQSADEKFKAVVGGYIQGLLEGRMIEAGNDTDTFRVRRARPKLSGHVFSKKIQYVFEYDISSNKLLEGSLMLVHSDAFKFKMGQFYVPFSLENVTSSSNLQFVDRSIMQAYFGLPDEREPGMSFSGMLADKKFEYSIGAFNGEGLNTINANNEFRYAARLVYNIAGHHGDDFADVGVSKDPQVSVAVGGMFNDTPDPATIPVGGTTATAEKKVYSVTPELNAKYHGLGFHAAYFYQRTNPDIGTTVSDQGFLAQAGYMITPKFEMAVRWGMIMPDVANDQAEYTVGLNYYISQDQRVKLQIDYSALTVDNGVAAGDNRLDHRGRAQLQIKL